VTLPSDVQKVLNARADDAIRAIYTAVEDGDREWEAGEDRFEREQARQQAKVLGDD
jgi:hypothetical protein